MTFHWMLESLHFQQLKFTWFYLTKVQFNEYKIWQTKKILKDELRGYCLLIVKWVSLCVASVWLFENFILSLYLICRIYVFVILKELLSKKVMVIHKLKVGFFLNLSTCLCLYAKNIYNKNNYEYVYFGRYSVEFVFKFIQILTIYRYLEDQLVHKCSPNCKIYWARQDKEWQTKDCISVLRNSYRSQKHK